MEFNSAFKGLRNLESREAFAVTVFYFCTQELEETESINQSEVWEWVDVNLFILRIASSVSEMFGLMQKM
jgi:hypothetical protein